MQETRKRNEKTVKIKIEAATPTRRKKDVLVEFILDETGSMEEYREDVIRNYNKYLESQRKEKTKGRCYWSLTKFNSGHTMTVHERVDVDNVIGIDRYSYRPGGSTNLYDAIGLRLSRLLSDRDLLRNTSVVIIVFTDGYENCSREFKYDHVRDLIRKCEAEGWTFVYMGANQDAWEVGSSIGVSNQYNTRTFSMAQTDAAFASLTGSTIAYRNASMKGIQTSASAYNFFQDAPSVVAQPATASMNVKVPVVIDGDLTVKGNLKVESS